MICLNLVIVSHDEKGWKMKRKSAIKGFIFPTKKLPDETYLGLTTFKEKKTFHIRAIRSEQVVKKSVTKSDWI